MKTKTRQARKQRRRLHSLSMHQKRKQMAITLSKPLREKFKRRSLIVRKGDKVKVMTGKFKGVEGEVMKVNVSDMKMYVEKVVSKKRDGTDVLRKIDPSNLMLIDIDIRDKERQAVLSRKVSATVVAAEAEKEAERFKKEEVARKAREEEQKRKEAEKKADKEKKEETKAGTAGEKKEIKVSEKGIDDKTKKDWVKVSEKGIDDKTKKDWVKVSEKGIDDKIKRDWVTEK